MEHTTRRCRSDRRENSRSAPRLVRLVLWNLQLRSLSSTHQLVLSRQRRVLFLVWGRSCHEPARTFLAPRGAQAATHHVRRRRPWRRCACRSSGRPAISAPAVATTPAAPGACSCSARWPTTTAAPEAAAAGGEAVGAAPRARERKRECEQGGARWRRSGIHCPDSSRRFRWHADGWRTVSSHGPVRHEHREGLSRSRMLTFGGRSRAFHTHRQQAALHAPVYRVVRNPYAAAESSHGAGRAFKQQQQQRAPARGPSCLPSAPSAAWRSAFTANFRASRAALQLPCTSAEALRQAAKCEVPEEMSEAKLFHWIFGYGMRARKQQLHRQQVQQMQQQQAGAANPTAADAAEAALEEHFREPTTCVIRKLEQVSAIACSHSRHLS